MPVPSSMSELAVNAANNSPPGGEIGPALGDDYFRGIQAILRRESAKGADLAIVSGILTPGNDGNKFVVTTVGGSLNGIANTWVGRDIGLVFSGVVTVVHSSNLILPRGANITTEAATVLWFSQESTTPVWRCTGQVLAGAASPIQLLERKVIPAGGVTAQFLLTPYLSAFPVFRFRVGPGFVMSADNLVVRFSNNGGASFLSGAGDYNTRLTILFYATSSHAPINETTFGHIRLTASNPGVRMWGDVNIEPERGYLRSLISQFSWATEVVAKLSSGGGDFNAILFSPLSGTFSGPISMYGEA